MTYELLYKDFCTLYNDYLVELKKMQDDLMISNEDGMHVFFGLIVTPFVLKLIEKDNKNAAQKAFKFFEDMVLSGSSDICEILEFSILETMISNRVLLDDCKKMMLPETRKCCETVESWYITN